MRTAPASTPKVSSAAAAMAHIADRLVAHHMNQDAASANPPATMMIRIASTCYAFRNRPDVSERDQAGPTNETPAPVDSICPVVMVDVNCSSETPYNMVS